MATLATDLRMGTCQRKTGLVVKVTAFDLPERRGIVTIDATACKLTLMHVQVTRGTIIHFHLRRVEAHIKVASRAIDLRMAPGKRKSGLLAVIEVEVGTQGSPAFGTMARRTIHVKGKRPVNTGGLLCIGRADPDDKQYDDPTPERLDQGRT